MPKHKKKGRGGRGGESNSDDESMNDNASVYSFRSDGGVVGGVGGGGGGGCGSMDDESEEIPQSTVEKYEEKLLQALENATEKSVHTRVVALKAINEILMHRYLPDFIDDHKVTIMDIIEKSIKRGKSDEQVLGAQMAPLLILQLGGCGSEMNEITKTLSQHLLIITQNKNALYDTRAKCCTALGLLNFLGADDIGELIILMQHFESIFSASYLKGDKTPTTATALESQLHSAALGAWGLLITLIPSGDFCSLMTSKMQPSITNLMGMLQSPHLDTRMAAGEVIALAFECGRDHDEDFLVEHLPEIIEITKKLATDSLKYRAKRDRKVQRATFRDIVRYLEEETYPDITIRFGAESLELNSWSIHHQYTTLCTIMGPGMTSHLQENDFLREVLQLGTKIVQPNSTAVNKQSKLERHLINAASFKARTLTRNKNRDKRSAVFN